MPQAELIKCVCFDLPCDKEKKKSEMLSEKTWGRLSGGEPAS